MSKDDMNKFEEHEMKSNETSYKKLAPLVNQRKCDGKETKNN